MQASLPDTPASSDGVSPFRRPGQGRHAVRSCGVDRVPCMPRTVAELVDLLELEPIEVGLYRGQQPDTSLQRVFGGQVLGQALAAASRTVPEERGAHSL